MRRGLRPAARRRSNPPPSPGAHQSRRAPAVLSRPRAAPRSPRTLRARARATDGLRSYAAHAAARHQAQGARARGQAATTAARGVPHRGVSVAARIRKLAKARLRVGAYAQSARFTRLVLLGHAVQKELVREQLRATGVARASLGICQHRYDRVVRPEPGSQRLIEK